MSGRIYLPQSRSGEPVYTGSPTTWISYSGSDIRASIWTQGRWVQLGNLYTISYSSYRDMNAVRGLGQASALAITRGYRTIAGSMVFTQFNKGGIVLLPELHP